MINNNYQVQSVQDHQTQLTFNLIQLPSNQKIGRIDLLNNSGAAAAVSTSVSSGDSKSPLPADIEEDTKMTQVIDSDAGPHSGEADDHDGDDEFIAQWRARLLNTSEHCMRLSLSLA